MGSCDEETPLLDEGKSCDFGGGGSGEDGAGHLLDVKKLRVCFRVRGKEVRAVEDVSFSLGTGKILALVGESGSGKSVSALALAGLLSENAVVSGEVYYRGRDVLGMSGRALCHLRGREIAYIFQEPCASLNPVLTVGFQIAESVRRHFPHVRDVKARVASALGEVGLGVVWERVVDAYPHELSGGMLQRAMIAMALVCEPQLLVADEPTTALDVTVQKRILELIMKLRERRRMAVLLITHNFGIAAACADEIAVMRNGRVVEKGTAREVLFAPRDAYTRLLVACVPRLKNRPVAQ
ncbi:MAG: ABC transporter ATP-binding protein [Puniceicoccales bacterium]|nr:ABC transporter ATP-binding protein [Puniceicoccales bacterium]